MGLVAGKVALVTGAAAGIGRASAVAFAREGARVVVVDDDVEGGEKTVAMVEEIGGTAVFVECDVSDAADVEAAMAKTMSAFGRLDCAHNNAGIEGPMALTAEYEEEDWDRLIDVNLKGAWLCMKHEIPRMLFRGGGAIVNTASFAGIVGVEGLSSYSASKFGVTGITKVAALEYASMGIRVNAVCPGPIQTAMIDRLVETHPDAVAELLASAPMGRLGRPEEIAEAAVWLCSDRASFVNGHAMVVDGAFTAR
ncbi:SDR family oxidoreductase [Actinotalea sp. M2MS4P-6]|uniref:SDR family oxidoreductase n=1 Tax=Actinotalea sp. M2MS4P-6 TaxID=2983762 RepID=UPI0021E382C7|nr:SDR family oxidoreductase [Actinotalea sp. M2MS4P-6]MCV2395167.1 SDR family oxidoreductase [Actinotalea sp. M2MS4P-6]